MKKVIYYVIYELNPTFENKDNKRWVLAYDNEESAKIVLETMEKENYDWSTFKIEKVSFKK